MPQHNPNLLISGFREAVMDIGLIAIVLKGYPFKIRMFDTYCFFPQIKKKKTIAFDHYPMWWLVLSLLLRVALFSDVFFSFPSK